MEISCNVFVAKYNSKIQKSWEQSLLYLCIPAKLKNCCIKYEYNLTIPSFLFCFLKDLVNIEMFLTAKEVEESLERQETMTCLAWCHDNKSRLRKMKVWKYNMFTFYFICCLNYLDAGCGQYVLNYRSCLKVRTVSIKMFIKGMGSGS